LVFGIILFLQRFNRYYLHFFYTAITVPTNKMADDLKRSGGFIPGVKPGVETADFLDKIMSLITFPGSYIP
jgi:preprotein translocase subunit SecY